MPWSFIYLWSWGFPPTPWTTQRGGFKGIYFRLSVGKGSLWNPRVVGSIFTYSYSDYFAQKPLGFLVFFREVQKGFWAKKLFSEYEYLLLTTLGWVYFFTLCLFKSLCIQKNLCWDSCIFGSFTGSSLLQAFWTSPHTFLSTAKWGR